MEKENKTLSCERMITSRYGFAVYPEKKVKEFIKDVLEFPAWDVEALKKKIRKDAGKSLI